MFHERYDDMILQIYFEASIMNGIILILVSREIKKIVLINPNSNSNSTKSMADLARLEADGKYEIVERTNTGVPLLLSTPEHYTNAVSGVVQIGKEEAKDGNVVAIIVSAFSDPGLKELRAEVDIPVFGIGEEVFHAAAEGNRKFGIVTITPNPSLLKSFADKAKSLGYENLYQGVRVTEGDFNDLVASPSKMDAALIEAVNNSISLDSAGAVIVGCGPCSIAGLRIQTHFDIPIEAAVPAAARAAIKTLQ